MTSHDPRPLAREISEFLAALRHRTENRPLGETYSPDRNAEVLAWKSSILDRIAEQTDDPETHRVAANARTQLDNARTAGAAGGEL